MAMRAGHSPSFPSQVEDLTRELLTAVLGVARPGVRVEAIAAAEAVYALAGRGVDVNEGNRLQRLVIGFGMGASTLDAEVYVYQQLRSGRRQLLQFSVHADSGKMPGAAVTMGAGAAAQGGVTAGMAAANAGVSGITGYRRRSPSSPHRAGAP